MNIIERAPYGGYTSPCLNKHRSNMLFRCSAIMLDKLRKLNYNHTYDLIRVYCVNHRMSYVNLENTDELDSINLTYGEYIDRYFKKRLTEHLNNIISSMKQVLLSNRTSCKVSRRTIDTIHDFIKTPIITNGRDMHIFDENITTRLLLELKNADIVGGDPVPLSTEVVERIIERVLFIYNTGNESINYNKKPNNYILSKHVLDAIDILIMLYGFNELYEIKYERRYAYYYNETLYDHIEREIHYEVSPQSIAYIKSICFLPLEAIVCSSNEFNYRNYDKSINSYDTTGNCDSTKFMKASSLMKEILNKVTI